MVCSEVCAAGWPGASSEYQEARRGNTRGSAFLGPAPTSLSLRFLQSPPTWTIVSDPSQSDSGKPSPPQAIGNLWVGSWVLYLTVRGASVGGTVPLVTS